MPGVTPSVFQESTLTLVTYGMESWLGSHMTPLAWEDLIVIIDNRCFCSLSSPSSHLPNIHTFYQIMGVAKAFEELKD